MNIISENSKIATEIDPVEIVRALNLFCVGVTEIRLLKCQGKYGGPFTVSGYFDRQNFHNAAMELTKLDAKFKPKGCYFIFNEISASCQARAFNRFVERPESTTSDKEILSRRWIFVDIDPPRLSGVSASDDEKEQAVAVREEVFERLKDIAEPIVAVSGNGFHLFIPINRPNNDDQTKLVQRLLKGLQSQYPMVDVTASNAARITKLYGTIGRKGDSTPDRPHRQSKIVYVPDYLKEGWNLQ